MPPEAREPRTSIILLTYTRPDLAIQRIGEYEIHLGHRDDSELVVFGNGPPPSARLALAGWTTHKGVRYEHCEPNRGFGGGFNEAVRRISGDRIVLLSDDVVIEGDFVDVLNAYASPWPENLIICKEMIRRPAGWNVFGTTVIAYPFAYFLALRRLAWNEIGGFDERYLPYDYEDMDLGMQALKRGIGVLEDTSLPVRHVGAQTIPYSPERREITIHHRALFAEKWGLDNIPERL